MEKRNYIVVVKTLAEKKLNKLPSHIRAVLLQAIQKLADDPRPPGCRKLQGYTGLYRIRSGDYRILYSIEDKILTVFVTQVGHRSEVYE